MRVLGAMLLLAVSATGDPVKPEWILLTRIRVVMAENLQRLPNYTCLQTIERSRRPAPSRKFQLVDTLRLEVALVGGKELFSWPGAGRFEDRDMRDFVAGTSGNGSFGLHARGVFLSAAPRFTYVGERERNGRKTVRFDYEVPEMLSGFQLRVGTQSAVVAYRGAFWVDATTLDLIRLEVQAVDIPPNLGLKAAGDAMEYARVRIGEGDFLLPESSELTMVDLEGGENVNRTRFSACRQYAGESVITFAEAPEMEATPAVAAPPAPIELPPDVTLDLELEAPVRFDKAAIGDQVAARLRSDGKRKGEILLRKGARIEGRIIRMERWGGGDYYVLGFRLESVESGGRQGALHAELIEVGPLMMGAGAGRRQAPVVVSSRELADPGAGFFTMHSRLLGIPKGFRMVWRTGSAVSLHTNSRNGDKQ